MNFLEGKTPAERNKIILAGALLLVAVIAVLRLFLFSPAAPPAPQANAGGANPAPNPTRAPNQQRLAQMRDDPLQSLVPVRFDFPPPSASEIGRNIFTYYVPPPPAPAAPRREPQPTPEPPPPLILAAVNPDNVYAGSGESKVSVTGDKFTADSQVTVDDRALPTQFVSAQQLTATVPADVIEAEGPRRVVVRTPDSRLYSNVLNFNVAAPPRAPYTYIALIGGPRYNDTAVLKEQSSNKLINVTRGQTVGGQWRVTSISDRAVELTHNSIRIKQQLRFESEQKNSAGGGAAAVARPTPPPPPPIQVEEEEENAPDP